MSDFVYFSFFRVQAAGALSIKIGKIFWFFFFLYRFSCFFSVGCV